MRKLPILIVVLALAAVSQQPQPPVELTSEPSHHQVLDNAFVRVFAVTIDPGKSTLMHRHGHDYLTVSIGDAQIMNAKEGAQPAPVTFKDGDVRFAPSGVVHAVTNTGSTQFRNATIELLGPTTNQKACAEACSVSVPCDSADKAACVTVNKVFTADQWTATLVTLPPGAKYAQHAHPGNFLVVSLTDGDVTMKSQGQPDVPTHPKTGAVTWNNPVVHTVTNTGKTTAKTVVLEFKGQPSGGGSQSASARDALKSQDHK
ncbi:MAG: hypothetical protein WA738_09320 [Candidatus Angelobacter sp.]